MIIEIIVYLSVKEHMMLFKTKIFLLVLHMGESRIVNLSDQTRIWLNILVIYTEINGQW